MNAARSHEGDVAKVAIVGMACRFPGAPDVASYWRNLCDGVESVTSFTDRELAAAGVDAATLADPDYVRAGSVLDDVEKFDAGFFGLNPAEARITDPQQRLFLETAWTALESAGIDPHRTEESVGVFAGSALSTYLMNNLAGNEDIARSASQMQLALGNDKDSLATRVAHAFDLTGPAYAVQSYCSTSLVAIANACSSLVGGECDVAMAGGAAISVPHRVGYRYQEGGIASPDGRCRAFDARAQGSPLGSGVGVVVLKRLDDAVADGEHIHAVLRGWAVNNDGALKVGYTAPGVRGQADAIAEAIASADLEPSDVDYIETHGTGTALGDAAEFAALSRVFGETGDCVLGSVKTNMGHLDRAAGVAGLIKTALSVEHGEIPPTLHFTEPNPQIDLDASPFRVGTERSEWRGANRLAGVSSFGIGGTNAHVVLERAPQHRPEPPRDRPRLLVFSARCAEAADERVRELGEHLSAHPELDLGATAQTLSLGRREFEFRRAAVVRDHADALRVLAGEDPQRLLSADEPAGGRELTFYFGGEGARLARLAAELFASEPEFQRAVRDCAQAADSGLPDAIATGADHPAAGFTIEYALAQLLIGWGATPDAVAGQHTGQLVAAAVGGALPLAEALRIEASAADDAQIPVHAGQPRTGDASALIVDFTAELTGTAELIGIDGDGVATVHEALAKLWLAGCPIDWAAYRGGDSPRRVPLPGYPFQRESYWVDPPNLPAEAPDGRLSIEDWCQVPAWRAAQAAEAGAPIGPFLVFADDGTFGAELAARLGSCVTVSPGEFGRDGTAFWVRPDSAEDFDRLAAQLAEDDLLPRTVVHLWSLTGSAAQAVDRQRRHGLDALTNLARALAGHGVADVRITVLADHLHAVASGDEVAPGKAAVTGACLAIPQEFPGWTCRTVDVTGATERSGELVDLVLSELGAPSSDTAVAYRDGTRLVLDYAAAPQPEGESPLRDGGTYLITGGLGNVGLLLAEHIARAVRAPNLVLSSRAGLSGSDTARGEAVARLRELGAEVLPVAADGAAPETIHAAVGSARERFGRIDGLVHAAGLTDPDRFQPIQLLETSTVDDHFGAKVDSLLALREALANDPPEFEVLFSSMSAVLGGLGFAAYAGANAVLDAYAQAGAGRVRSIDWDTWQPTAQEMDEDPALGASMTEFSMTVAEGLSTFDRVLNTPANQVVVSTGDLRTRLDQWVSQSAAHPTSGGAVSADPAEVERRMTLVWQEILGVDAVGGNDNFFDLGGNSLMGLQLVKRVGQEFGTSLSAVALFEAPTVKALSAKLGTGQETAAATRKRPDKQGDENDDIAIIGMAGRFPGAQDVAQFWRNLRDGKESISFFTDEELLASGVSEEELGREGYVRARPVLDDVAGFDSGFFGYSPREAELTDPQHRIFLECCWHALEDSGYACGQTSDIGVFGGTNISTYLHRLGEAGVVDESVSDYQVVIGNDKDSLTTSVSYKFDLTGPSMSVQTFCSTSLLAVHLAVRALRGGECELAMAGGVSVRVPDRVGHQHVEGGMESPDGHVRTFDAAAKGSMFGDGAAVVVVKRLADAIADGDTVRAVIKGSAVNNDGSLKVGFTAPSVSGQAQVVTRALRDAAIDPATVSYVEAHGTATELGDPIEMASLTRAYAGVPAGEHCAVGSVKSNVGHLDRAAGASGLIKTVLALENQQIPASLHYTAPNPEIDFANSPFYVNAELAKWTPPDGTPRRAGINSLGMGGTNVHVLLEEAPRQVPGTTGRSEQLLTISARSEAALEQASTELAGHLRSGTDAELADIAYTLQVGRKDFAHRRLICCTGADEAADVLEGHAPQRLLTRREPLTERPAGMMFAGVGEQYVGMARELYAREPVFATAVDECREIVEPLLGEDLREILFAECAEAGGDGLSAMLGRSDDAPASEAEQRLAATPVLQPAVYVVEYALGRLLHSWGVRPGVYSGYSLGEYVAATFAGVLDVPDALRLVAHRAKLIDSLPGGGMLAVSLPADQLADRIGTELDVAAINSAGQCVLAGPEQALDEFAATAERDELACRRLDTSHAFHSRMLAPVAGELTDWVRREISLAEPKSRYLSNVTGTWMSTEDATDPGYWARHMCRPVRFADNVGELLADPDRVLLEIGAGQSLGAFARQHEACPPERMPLIMPTLPARHEQTGDLAAVHGAYGKLWLSGVDVDWHEYHAGETRRRVPLPGYPFQRERFWVDPPAQPRGRGHKPAAAELTAKANGDLQQVLTELPRAGLDDWFFLPTWVQSQPPQAGEPRTDTPWLVFTDGTGVGAAVHAELTAAGARVHLVSPGEEFAEPEPGRHLIRPGEPEDYTRLVEQVRPGSVLHLWSLDAPPSELDTSAAGQWAVRRGYFSSLWLARALSVAGGHCQLVTASAQAHNVGGADPVRPESATVTGPSRVTPLEQTSIVARQVDVCVPDSAKRAGLVARQLLGEYHAEEPEVLAAWRGTRRWLPGYDKLPTSAADESELREGGVYLITGGLGGIGRMIASGFAKVPGVNLVLLGRSELPDRTLWQKLLDSEDTEPEQRRRIESVIELENAGAQVLVLAADVCDRDSVRSAITTAAETFGALDGVVHAAGVPGMGLLQFKEPENADVALTPKVYGTRALLDALHGQRPDFVALFSSITSVTGGGPGQVDYCSANAYLDAVAQQAAVDPDTRVISIDWGEWQWNAWGAGLSGYSEDVQDFFTENRRRQGITAEEGWQAFLRVLHADQPQVVVSTQDFSVIAELSRSFTIDSVLDINAGPGQSHARPDLGTSYVAPESDAERTIAGIWSAALGITDVGIHDNFFELGGNSLLGVELIATVRREFDVESLAPHVLYLSPTVSSLAGHVTGTDDSVDADSRRERGMKRRERMRARRNR